MDPYKNLLIYYFSGTGNTLKAVRWMEALAKEKQVTVDTVSADETSAPGVGLAPGRTLLGLCYPTHGFCAPWIILKLIFKFPRVKGVDVFFLNSRAGWGLPRIPFPGISGIATWLPMLVFWLKGYRVRGVLPLDMPHSWISFFPPNPRGIAQMLVARSEHIVRNFITKILEGQTSFRYSIWLTLPIDLALLPITIGYVLIGRFFLAKTLFTSSKCNGCQLCEKYCPVGAITMKGGRPYWHYTCESYMRCMNVCPHHSIQSWVTRIALITYGIFVAGMAFYPMNENLWFTLISILFFPLYWALHRAWGIRAVNALFTYTSMTRYWKRYLAPGLKAKDFKPKLTELKSVNSPPSKK